MNNLHNWHTEQIATLRIKEIERKLERVRLLREAGLTGTNWLARAIGAVHDRMITRLKALKDHSSREHAPYTAAGDEVGR